MAGKGRASLGFGDELDDIDPSAWAKPKTRDDKLPRGDEAGRRSDRLP